MSVAQWILNAGLLGWVLLRNLGTRPVTRSSYLLPLAIVAIAAVSFLRDVPVAGHDLQLELIGAGLGVVLGLAATAVTRTGSRDGRPTVAAGAAFAALWIAVIGGRIAFAQWATGSGAHAVGMFSIKHQITGADAWTAAFVLMALAMVTVRVASTALRIRLESRRADRPSPSPAGA